MNKIAVNLLYEAPSLRIFILSPPAIAKTVGRADRIRTWSKDAPHSIELLRFTYCPIIKPFLMSQ
jgi:hypothetical protein